MQLELIILFSVLLISLLSLIGVLFIFFKNNWLKKNLIYLVSFSAGSLLGNSFIHLLPESIEQLGFTLEVSLIILIGFLFSWFLEKIICWHHCHLPSTKDHIHSFGFINLFGDAVHNFLDGMIIAASYLIDFSVGMATSVAVALHEIPQEIGDFGVLLHSGFSKKKALIFNFLSALFAILGAVLVLITKDLNQNFIYYLMAFASGNFIYLASVDLIPELNKEVKVSKNLWQLAYFISGILVMLILKHE
jgi:zinc and cadmium transporter